MQFSLPYIDQPAEFWEQLAAESGQSIREVYFPVGDHVSATGRPVQPQMHLLAFLERSKLPKAVLLNPVILSGDWAEIKERTISEFRFLYHSYGIRKAIITDLRLARHIKDSLPGMEISLSTLAQIGSPEQIPYLEETVDALTLDTAILRDLAKIKAIRESFTGTVKLLVNEGCLPGCPYRVQHFYEMGRMENQFPPSLCRDLLESQPWLRLKSAWVLPQHLYFYEGLYDGVKLAGRVTLQEPEKYVNVFRAYLTGRALSPDQIGCGPAGMNQDIPISATFFETMIRCDKNCRKCHLCREYYDEYLRR